MKPWNIIGWFIIGLIVMALVGVVGYGIYKGICWLIGYLPSGTTVINWWAVQPAWLKWWIIPSFTMVYLTACFRFLHMVIDDINEMIRFW